MRRISIVLVVLLLALLAACGGEGLDPSVPELETAAAGDVLTISIPDTTVIAGVRWFVDGDSVDNDADAPYQVEIATSDYEVGEHEVRAAITVDILDQTSVVNRTVTFVTEGTGTAASDFPIELRGRAPEEATAVLSLDVPGDAAGATLTLDVYDADFADEGELYVNGRGPIALFGSSGSSGNDRSSSSMEIDTPVSWWRDGDNELRFVHTRTSGFRIDDATVAFSSGGNPEPEPEPEPAPPPPTGDTGTPTLLASYRLRHVTGTQYGGVTYRPRQFDRSPYQGWDALELPGGVYRTYSYPDWLTLELNRDATLVVLWDGSDPASWLNSWNEVGTVGGQRAYRKRFARGEVVLGGIGGTENQPYTVLFAEADGRPSAEPAAPSGRSTPAPNTRCPAWVHDQYVTDGPDGRSYRTWHPQIDPVYWCYFGHTHYSDPGLLTEGGSVEFAPVYNYFADKGGPEESHLGFHGEVLEYTDTSDGRVYRLYKHAHADTSMQRRACAEIHAHQLVLYDVAADEIVANIHHKISFGPSRDAATFDKYRPSNCPANADISVSRGARNIPQTDNNGYETWQAVYDHYPQLGISGRHTVAYVNPKTNCVGDDCSSVRSSGEVNDRVWVITPESSRGLGITFDADTAFNGGGVFYTDLYGERQLSASDPDAVRQYIKPGLDVTLVSAPRHFSNDPWRYAFTDTSKTEFAIPSLNLEDGLDAAN